MMTSRDPIGWRALAHEDKGLLVLALILGLVTAYLYPSWPDTLPIHWNWRGEADGFAPKLVAALLMPGTLAFVWPLLWWVPTADPRRDSYLEHRDTYRAVRGLIIGVFLGIDAMLLAVWSGTDIAVGQLVYVLTGVLFAGIGNVLGRVRPNHTFGIRVPWTIADDEVWRQTHRFAAPLWFVGGISICLLALLPAPVRALMLLLIIITLSIAPIVYAYQRYQAK